MRDYALEQTAILLRRFAFQVNRSKSPDPDTIHDLRVSIRRLSRCLRVFSQFYPDSSWKRIRKELKSLMEVAGAARDCDIALELLKEAGVSQRAGIIVSLSAERAHAARELAHEVERLSKRNFSRKWRARLGL
jgi:CHAD domain-containing protein